MRCALNCDQRCRPFDVLRSLCRGRALSIRCPEVHFGCTRGSKRARFWRKGNEKLDCDDQEAENEKKKKKREEKAQENNEKRKKDNDHGNHDNDGAEDDVGGEKAAGEISLFGNVRKAFALYPLVKIIGLPHKGPG